MSKSEDVQLQEPRSRQTSGDYELPDPDDIDLNDFTQPDELCSVILLVEDQKLYLHKEVLSVWSPVFKSMFTQDFKEKGMKEIELPDKKIDDFVELLHCLYPPIKPVSDSNVKQLLPLAEEYQINEVKRKCEEHLLKGPCSMELLITAQIYNLEQLLQKCIKFARNKCYSDLQKDPLFESIEPGNLIRILQLRVQDLEEKLTNTRKNISERDSRLYGYINELGSQYGNFCQDCKTRKVNDSCFSCLKMFREKVKQKVEEAKVVRSHYPRIDI